MEEGIHALDSGLNGSEYARQSGKKQPEVARRVMAARVFKVMPHGITDPTSVDWRNLAEIHAAPESTWALLAGLLQEHSWSVKETKAAVDRIRSIADLAPDWPKNLPRIFAWAYGEQPGAETAPRPLKDRALAELFLWATCPCLLYTSRCV